MCILKSQNTFICIWCGCLQKGWSWNGLVADFLVLTNSSEKTAIFVHVAQNLIIPHLQVRCDATNHRSPPSMYVGYLIKVGDLETPQSLTSWRRHSGRHKLTFSIFELRFQNSINSGKSGAAKLKIALHLFEYVVENSSKRRVLKLTGIKVHVDCRRKKPTGGFIGLRVQNLAKRHRKPRYKA